MDQRIIIKNQLDMLERKNFNTDEIIRLYKLLDKIEQNAQMPVIYRLPYQQKQVNFNMVTKFIKQYKLALSSYRSKNKKICPHVWTSEQFLLICKLHKHNNKRHRKMFKRLMPGVNLSDILTIDIKLLYKNIVDLIFCLDISNIIIGYLL
jgi:hypothetical protein